MRELASAAVLSLAAMSCGGATVASPDPVGADESTPVATTEGEGEAGPSEAVAAPAVPSSGEWAREITEANVLPLFELEGRRWVQLEDVPFHEHPALDPPADWGASELPGQPVAAAVDGHAAVVVLGTDGPCTAALGPPMFVDRSGCVPDAAIAQELLGCEGEIAPLAWVDAAPDADATWAPVDFVPPWAWLDNDAEVPTLRSTAPFSLLAAFESDLLIALAEAGVVANDFESAAMMGWAVGGEETVSVLYAAAHTLGTPECHDYAMTFVAVGFEVEGGWRSVADDFPIAGVLADGPEVAALVGTGNRRHAVMVRREKYVFETAFDVVSWFENAECVEPITPVSFEQDCGP